MEPETGSLFGDVKCAHIGDGGAELTCPPQGRASVRKSRYTHCGARPPLRAAPGRCRTPRGRWVSSALGAAAERRPSPAPLWPGWVRWGAGLGRRGREVETRTGPQVGLARLPHLLQTAGGGVEWRVQLEASSNRPEVLGLWSASSPVKWIQSCLTRQRKCLVQLEI